MSAFVTVGQVLVTHQHSAEQGGQCTGVWRTELLFQPLCL